MGNTLGKDMGNTFFLSSLLRRSALAGVRCVRARYVLYRSAIGAWKLSSATSILGRAHSTRIAFPEFSYQHAAEIDPPFLPARLEAHWVSNECFPYEAFSSLPLDLPVAPDPSRWAARAVCAGVAECFLPSSPDAFARAHRFVRDGLEL